MTDAKSSMFFFRTSPKLESRALLQYKHPGRSFEVIAVRQTSPGGKPLNLSKIKKLKFKNKPNINKSFKPLRAV